MHYSKSNSSVQSLGHVQFFATPWITACQASPSINNSQSSLKLMSIESMMLSSHLNLCHPLLLLPFIFPILKVFFSESSLHVRWPEFWSLSFSISPSRVDFLQDWMVWSPCNSRDSQESSPALQFEGIDSVLFSLFDGPSLTSIHDYWKDCSFDYTYGLLSARWCLCFLTHCLGLS